jgi:hypothetical protein
MSRLRGVRWWHGLVSVVVAAGVGVLTNLATGGFSWALTVSLVVLVVAQMGLSVWQAGRDRQDLRAARDAMLGQLRPPAPIFAADETATGHNDEGSGARGVVHLLTAPFSPTPLWGRSVVHDRLVAWCEHRDPRAEVARVVVGSAGVGKCQAPGLMEGGLAGFQGCGDRVGHRV